ncbi:MAG: transcriptional regulator, partial [Pirellulales bacterium]|nr:transcriptional regulator [Pirellulales bacterium]
MNQPAKSTKTKAEELPREITELVNVVGELPADIREKIDPVLSRVVDSSKRRRRILQLVQDALSQLRLDMKYLMFDLEATR